MGDTTRHRTLRLVPSGNRLLTEHPTSNAGSGSGSADSGASNGLQEEKRHYVSDPSNLGFEKMRLLNIDEVPVYLRDDGELLKTGYRYGGSYLSCLRSVFQPHNEVMNMWTMVGSFFISLVLYVHSLRNHVNDVGDFVTFTCLFCMSAVHLPFTFGYHCFLPISPTVMNNWRRMDIQMISFMAVCLTIALSRYVFIDSSYSVLRAARFFVPGMTLAVAIFTLPGVLRLRPGKPTDKGESTRRGAMLAATYIIPLLYALIRDTFYMFWIGDSASLSMHTHYYFLGVVACVLCAGATYGCRIPEKVFPVTFDVFGNSHQWMHVFILVKYLIEYAFVVEQRSRVLGHCGV